MPIYRMIFVRNTVLTCVEVADTVKLDGDHYYEHEKGQMIFAIIRAFDEDSARTRANELIEELAMCERSSKYFLAASS